ncbi:MAG: AAA family ATPase [Candidatus Pacearchaeota archaeon]
MLIKRIKLNNIRSYTEQEILFPKGSVLLSGDIGSGKTTVLLAIEFALFGLQKGIIDGTALLRNGTNQGMVELELEIDGRPIILKRTLKRKKDSVVQDSAILKINDKEKELSATELKAFILEILNYPPQLLKKQNLIYRYTVYTPQEHMKHILSSSPEERIDIIRKIFDIDKYKRIEDSCNIFISKLKEIIKLKQGQLSDFQFKKNELEKKKEILNKIKLEIQNIIPKFEKIQTELKEIKIENEKLKERIQKFNFLSQKLAKQEVELKEKRMQLEDYARNLEQLEIAILKLKKDVEIKIDYDIIKKREELEKEKEKKANEEKNIGKEIAAMMALKKKLEEDGQKISSLKICPVCKQTVTEDHRNKINLEIKEELIKINKSLADKEELIKKINFEFQELEKKIEKIREEERLLEILKIKKDNLKDKEYEKEILDKKIKKLSEEISLLEKLKKETENEFANYSDIEDQKIKIEKQLENKLDEEREIIKLKASFEKGKKDLEDEIKELELEIEEKEKIAKELEKIFELQNWLSKQFLFVVQQIEKQVMFKLNIEFNILFKKWFSMLVEDTLDARIDLEFTPLVEQAGYDISYEYLSGGERTALALAYRLALNQVINSMLSKISTKSILILDEPTEGFSSEQLDRMRQILQEINVDQLILVSHELKMESFVENVIRLSKEGNVSRIVN